METYNIYKCECGFIMDCNHVLILSLKIECPTCHKWLVHDEQITMDILQDWLS
jgi:hypothetical protein